MSDIMTLDINITYEDILKNEDILDTLTIGQLKGVHYNLHKIYNISNRKKDTKILIYKVHNILLKKLEKEDINHRQSDNLDIQYKKKIIEKKKFEIKKRTVFLIKTSIRKNG